MGARLRLKAGAWYVIVCHAGRRTSKKIGTDKRAAERFRREVEVALARDALIRKPDPEAEVEAPPPPTVADVAREWLQWLATVRTDVRPSSLETYRGVLRRYILPRLGSLPMGELTVDHVEQFCLALRAPGGAHRWADRGLSATTLAAALNPLGQLCQWAKRKGLLAVNPCRELDRGVKRRGARDAGAVPDPFTPAELRQLIAAALSLDPPLGDVLDLWARIGARRGEVLALTWAHLDLAHGTAHIQQTWSRARLSPPKSGRPRVVGFGYPVPEDVPGWQPWSTPEARALLARLRAWPVQPLDPASCYLVGGQATPMPERDWGRVWDRIIRRAGVRPRPCEQLRHTMASILLSRGCPPLHVRAIGGWASSQVLDKHYSRYMPSPFDSPAPPAQVEETRRGAPQARLEAEGVARVGAADRAEHREIVSQFAYNPES